MAPDPADAPSDPPLPRSEELTEAELRQLDLIASLHAPPDLAPHLSSILLRWQPAGTCILDAAANPKSVFYLPMWEEMLRLKLFQLEAAETLYEQILSLPAQERWREQTHLLQVWIEELTGVVARFEHRAWQSRGAKPLAEDRAPVARLEGRTGASPLAFFEGETLDAGELQAYTADGRLRIVATVDSYVLQLPRSLHQAIRRDAGYRQVQDALYCNGPLEAQLRGWPCFAQFEAEAMRMLVQCAELVTADAGALLCDENAAADAAYLVRSGGVDVRRRQTALLGADDDVDWTALCRQLLAGAEPEPPAAGPEKQ